FFFFFQAEDGIRDLYVTGVQTCALPIFQAVEGRLDPPALPIAALVVADLPLAAALAWDDRRDAALAEVSAQPVGVVALVGGQTLDPARRFGQHRRRGGHIAGVAGRQQEDAGAAEHIGERVDLGGLATPRRADGLRGRPPLWMARPSPGFTARFAVWLTPGTERTDGHCDTWDRSGQK